MFHEGSIITHCQEKKNKNKNQHILQSVMQPNISGHLNRPTFRERGGLFCITLSRPVKTESIVRHETYHGLFGRMRTFLISPRRHDTNTLDPSLPPKITQACQSNHTKRRHGWQKKENYKSRSGLKVTPQPVQTSQWYVSIKYVYYVQKMC